MNRSGTALLLVLACVAALTACVGREPPGKRLAQGILENETLGVTFRPGMTREEIEAQPIETFVSSSNMGTVEWAQYGMNQKDSITVYYIDSIACNFHIAGEIDRALEKERGDESEWFEKATASSHWTVDGLGFGATREDIKAWYGSPTWEAEGNLSYRYREDGSFIDGEMHEAQEEEIQGCAEIDDGAVLTMTFSFFGAERVRWIDVAGQVPQALG